MDKITIIIDKEVKYNRNGQLILKNDKVVFDTSNEEYGPIVLDLSLLKEKIKEHDSK